MTVCGKGSIDIGDGIFHDVLCVPSLSSNLLFIYQITHSGTGKTIEFAQDSMHIRDSETINIIATGTVDHASRLYSFSHFGPPSPLSKTVKLGRLNLCVVPKTSVVTSTPPPLVQIPSITQDYSSSFPTIVAPIIKPPIVVIEDILEDTHLLLDDKFNTPAIPPTLEIPF